MAAFAAGLSDQTPAATVARVPNVGVIALVPDLWRDIWMPRHQVCHRLARHFEVVWIEAARPWRDYLSLTRKDDVIQNVTPDAAHFTIFDPGWRLPEVYRPAWLRDAVRRRRVRIAERILKNRGCTRIILYLWRPAFDWALDAIDADLACYHIDDEYNFKAPELPNDAREVALIERVDQVFIHSRRLLEKKGGINSHTSYAPNGVDYRAYSSPVAEPADLAAIPRPRMGYVGVVKAQLDLELLLALAERNQQWSFVVVGPRGFVDKKAPLLDRMETLPNVHFLGNRGVEDLPGYVQHMDVCMMPYEVNAYTNFIYPLKLHEYLAAGRPTVAKPIDSVLPFSDVVSLASTLVEWEAALAEGLAPEANSDSAVGTRRARAAEHDWDFLVAQIAGRMEERLEAVCRSPAESQGRGR